MDTCPGETEHARTLRHGVSEGICSNLGQEPKHTCIAKDPAGGPAKTEIQTEGLKNNVVWACKFSCGFRGSYKQVAAHEQACKLTEKNAVDPSQASECSAPAHGESGTLQEHVEGEQHETQVRELREYIVHLESSLQASRAAVADLEDKAEAQALKLRQVQANLRTVRSERDSNQQKWETEVNANKRLKTQIRGLNKALERAKAGHVGIRTSRSAGLQFSFMARSDPRAEQFADTINQEGSNDSPLEMRARLVRARISWGTASEEDGKACGASAANTKPSSDASTPRHTDDSPTLAVTAEEQVLLDNVGFKEEQRKGILRMLASRKVRDTNELPNEVNSSYRNTLWREDPLLHLDPEHFEEDYARAYLPGNSNSSNMHALDKLAKTILKLKERVKKAEAHCAKYKQQLAMEKDEVKRLKTQMQGVTSAVERAKHNHFATRTSRSRGLQFSFMVRRGWRPEALMCGGGEGGGWSGAGAGEGEWDELELVTPYRGTPAGSGPGAGDDSKTDRNGVCEREGEALSDGEQDEGERDGQREQEEEAALINESIALQKANEFLRNAVRASGEQRRRLEESVAAKGRGVRWTWSLGQGMRVSAVSS